MAGLDRCGPARSDTRPWGCARGLTAWMRGGGPARRRCAWGRLWERLQRPLGLRVRLRVALLVGWLVGLLGVGLAGAACARPPAAAAASALAQRSAEAAACPAGPPLLWRDGTDRAALSRPLVLLYHPWQAPAALPPARVIAVLRAVQQAWSPCGVPIELARAEAGQVAPDRVAEGQPIPLLWDDAAARGAAGLADLGRRRLALSPGVFTLLGQRQPPERVRDTLTMVIAHELGHLLGLVAHSRRCIDVMSYYTGGQGERCSAGAGVGPADMPPGEDYRWPLPTACDIARCRALNAPSPR